MGDDAEGDEEEEEEGEFEFGEPVVETVEIQ